VPIVQAGGSAAGKKFASKWADTIITEGSDIQKMKEYRQEVRRNAAAIGRNPDDIKLLFLCSPIVDTTMEAAIERRRLQQEDSLKHVEMQLSGMSRLTGIDFSKFDMDEPLPMTLTTNGHQSSLARWLGKPLREIVRTYASKGSLDYTGTPDHVAGVMQDVMQEVGGDGFLISDTPIDRRGVMEICDGLVPELQRRGLTRKAYAHKHLRDNLLEF
jgi:alkanesulfonate monooxygenase SsuD/methylene tetrahydromethanopterin reductase-like flavin-dependent oxidoreductase (luciferase family)